jgi:hypothetical protein
MRGEILESGAAEIFDDVDHFVDLEGEIASWLIFNFTAIVDRVKIVLTSTSAFEFVIVVFAEPLLQEKCCSILQSCD